MKKDYIKSLLFIPAHKKLFFKNLNKIKADALAIDLEDSVPSKKKNEARQNLLNLKNLNLKKKLFIRLNNDKSNLLNDIKYSFKSGIQNFILPKIKSSKDINLIIKKIKKIFLKKKIKILVLIENPNAIINLKEICSSSKSIKGLIFGAEDYLNDINNFSYNNNASVDFVRSLIPIYAHAYNLDCIDTPHLNLINQKNFLEHLKISKSLGYTGILNVHPKQVNKSNLNYLPSTKDVNIAKKILSTGRSDKYLKSKIFLINNKLVGPPMIKRSKKILMYFNEK